MTDTTNTWTRIRAWRHRSALVLACVLVACTEVSGPADPSGAVLAVSASVANTRIALLVVTVSAADISPPLVANIPIVNGIASGTITVTAGSDRIVAVHAYDANGVETHRGGDTVTVQAGTNPPITLTLLPLQGDVPIVVTLAGLRIAVAPSPDTLVAGGATQSLTATLTTTGGAPVSGTVLWATLDPGIAVVDVHGIVSGTGPGTTQIVATYAGVAGLATVVVLAPNQVPPALRLAASGLSMPIFATAPPGDTLRLFILEQPGRIRIVRRDTLLATAFLDVSAIVSCCGERGLLGLAFDPHYAANGLFFLDYTDVNGDTRVVRYHAPPGGDVADAGSASPVLFQTQPFSNHNGGMLAFGPGGFLYVGFGDGGSGGDPFGNGQNMNTWLGKILRLDVGGPGYVVPAGNPFVNRTDTLPEIWASGLRNPWRFSFDRTTGDLYIGDVGQDAREEIDVEPAPSAGGRDYGWNVMEGIACYNAASCVMTGLTLPVLDYPHSVGCSVIGGYVYRGTRVPMLSGVYLYSDYCNGWVHSFRYAAGAVTEARDWPALAPGGNVSSFGEDARGELYVLSYSTGKVYRIVPSRL